MTTENQVGQETKQPTITASKQLWETFVKWMNLRGHQTLPEGLRAAMIEVTQFNPKEE